MKIKKVEVVCGCCGKKVEIEIIQSMLSTDYGLDNKPQFQWQLPLIQECPACRYCGLDISKPVKKGVGSIVKLPQYQKIMNGSYEDAYDLRVKSAAKLSVDTEDKIYLYLISCWNLEFNEKHEGAGAMRARVVELMESLLEEKAEFEMVMMYIDSLRQLGRFDSAMETLESITETVEKNLQKEDILYAIFHFEKFLLQNADAKPHMISEVSA